MLSAADFLLLFLPLGCVVKMDDSAVKEKECLVLMVDRFLDSSFFLSFLGSDPEVISSISS